MTMTDFTKEIRVPVWLITLICGVLLTLLGAMWRQAEIQARQAAIQSKIIEQVERLRHDVDLMDMRTRSAAAELRESKVDRREFDRLCVQLDRIEEFLKEK